ncbi:MAG: cupin domain-containing protein [Pseudomonadota bacterium]
MRPWSFLLIPMLVLTMAGTLNHISDARATELIERTELKRADLTGEDGKEVVVLRVVLHPGATLPRHKHPGDEFAYIAVGGTVETGDGREIEFVPGQVLHFPRDTAHGGFTVTGDTPLEAVATYIVDKGVPLVELVEE